MMGDNVLYYGDNLEVLRNHIHDESVDLIYLDPPFNSNQEYNVIFKERSGKESEAQIKAFTDTWKWNEEAAKTYEDIILAGDRTGEVMEAFKKYLGNSDMMAYLTMMAPRLKRLHRALKSTGSIY